MAKFKKEPMVNMLVKVTQEMRNELEAIRATTGQTLSQQVRMSLTLWIKRMSQNPEAGLQMMARMTTGFRITGQPDAPQGSLPGAHKGYLDTISADYDPDKDPQPDQAQHPAAWSAWNKRQGDYTISLLAKGIFRADMKKDQQG